MGGSLPQGLARCQSLDYLSLRLHKTAILASNKAAKGNDVIGMTSRADDFRESLIGSGDQYGCSVSGY